MRRVLLSAYAAYLLTAAYLVLWPQPDTPAGAVSDIVDGLESVGISFVSGTVIEFLLNVVLFVPFTLLPVLLWPRVNPLLWVLLGLGATVVIESVQYAVLPDRSATLSDLVSNSLGTLLGADIGLRLHFRAERRRAEAAGEAGDPGLSD